MKECPFSYSRAGYKTCQTSSCALWHRDSGKCSMLAIADILYSKKQSCTNCIHKKEKHNYQDCSYTVICERGHFLNNPDIKCEDFERKE